MMNAERIERLRRVNELLGIIGGCGHRFFYHKGHYARFVMDRRGRVWFVDAYTQRRIYTHRGGWEWSRSFSNGGTLSHLVANLQRFIMWGKLLRFDYFDNGTWAYGADMEIVRAAARSLGIVARNEEHES